MVQSQSATSTQKNNEADLSSKAWRSNPAIINAKVVTFDRRPFGVVAAVFLGSDVIVGVSRCNPTEAFNELNGVSIAVGRAKLELATHMDLLSPSRVKRLRKRTEERKAGLPTQMRVSREEFCKIFNITKGELPRVRPSRSSESAKKPAKLKRKLSKDSKKKSKSKK